MATTVQRGTVFHERFTGGGLLRFIDDGHLSWKCGKDDAGSGNAVAYSLAVTIRSGHDLADYENYAQRLHSRPLRHQRKQSIGHASADRQLMCDVGVIRWLKGEPATPPCGDLAGPHI